MSEDRNNLAYWFPRLEATGVLVPKTRLVFTNLDLLDLLDGQVPAGFGEFMGELLAAAHGFGWPIFLRTGYGSGKHEWRDTCHVGTPGDLPSHVAALVEWSHLVDFIGLPTDVWAVREFLSLDDGFHAFQGMPVARERRYFIRDGEVVCHHPYWPLDAVRQPDCLDWEERLRALNAEPSDEVRALEGLSKRVAGGFDGAWSLDWARMRDGRWIAIDMALAAESWHPEECSEAEVKP